MGWCRADFPRPRRPYPSLPQGLPPLRPHQGLRPCAPRGAPPRTPLRRSAPAPRFGAPPRTPIGLNGLVLKRRTGWMTRTGATTATPRGWVGDRDGTPGPKPGQGRAHGQPYYDHAPAARWEIGTAPPAPNPPSAERTASPTPPPTDGWEIGKATSRKTPPRAERTAGPTTTTPPRAGGKSGRQPRPQTPAPRAERTDRRHDDHVRHPPASGTARDRAHGPTLRRARPAAGAGWSGAAAPVPNLASARTGQSAPGRLTSAGRRPGPPPRGSGGRFRRCSRPLSAGGVGA